MTWGGGAQSSAEGSDGNGGVGVAAKIGKIHCRVSGEPPLVL